MCPDCIRCTRIFVLKYWFFLFPCWVASRGKSYTDKNVSNALNVVASRVDWLIYKFEAIYLFRSCLNIKNIPHLLSLSPSPPPPLPPYLSSLCLVITFQDLEIITEKRPRALSWSKFWVGTSLKYLTTVSHASSWGVIVTHLYSAAGSHVLCSNRSKMMFINAQRDRYSPFL